ncbi:MAG TPA: hypothetical protein VGG03_05890 [Thermoanaerobaculia bacterium]|jgi:hypothetical protein
MRPTDLEPGPCIHFYFDRYRGVSDLSRHVFAIYDEDGIRRWWCEAPQYASTPEELIEKITEYEASKNATVTLIAAGSMSKSAIDFTLLLVSPDDIPSLIVVAFSAEQNSRCLLYRYEDARILLNSQDPGWGTVGEVVEAHGFSIVR